MQKRRGFNKTEKQRMLLSEETRYGLKMTCEFVFTFAYWSYKILGRSFIELVRFLFIIPGVDSFLSQRLCQDPLERFFGCQRQRGGVHDNPNVAEFSKNTQALRVINSFCHVGSKGNCRGGNVEMPDENVEPLPKRRCSRSKVHHVVTKVASTSPGRDAAS